MKKWIGIALAGTLLFCTSVTPAHAYRVPNAGVIYSSVVLDEDNNDPEALAAMLQKLGLLQGTGTGFALDRQMTRAEAAAMLVRFLGGETQAQDAASACPFDDVPDWARGYVGWLYQNGLAKGLTKTLYGAEQNVTGLQFATFLSRVLAGDDDYMAHGILTKNEADNLAELPGYSTSPFYRSQAVAVAVRTLTLPRTRDSGTGTLAAWMVGRGLFSAESFGAAARGVLRPAFDYVELDGARYIAQSFAGVTVAHCAEPDLVFDAFSFQDANISYLLAGRVSESQLEYFTVDAQTLETHQIGGIAAPGASAPDMTGFIAAPGGKTYLLARWRDLAGQPHTGPLLSWDGNALVQEFSADALDFTAQDVCFFVPTNTYRYDGSKNGMLFVYTKDGLAYTSDTVPQWRRLALGPQERLLKSDGTSCVITLTRGAGMNVLARRSLIDGAATEAFEIPDDALGERPVASTDFSRRGPICFSAGQSYFYGEGGLYELRANDTGKESTRLVRITDQPVVSMATVRWGAAASDLYILTHRPGTRVADEIACIGSGADGSSIRVKTSILTTAETGVTDLKFAETIDSMLLVTGRNGIDAGEYTYDIVDRCVLNVSNYTPDEGELTYEERNQKCGAEAKRIGAQFS